MIIICLVRCITANCLAEYESTGLHSMEAPVGTYIAFACSPNQPASDGEIMDRNGLFAKHLLKHIAKPNKDIKQLFRTVTNGVCIESKQKQRPIRMDGLVRSEQVYLNEKSVTTSSGKKEVIECLLIKSKSFEGDGVEYIVHSNSYPSEDVRNFVKASCLTFYFRYEIYI
jgi:hypothetical protein